jgi:hypothetical protein
LHLISKNIKVQLTVFITFPDWSLNILVLQTWICQSIIGTIRPEFQLCSNIAAFQFYESIFRFL